MTERGKQPGNIGELMTMCMCVLALTVVMLNYLQNVQLLQAKENEVRFCQGSVRYSQ